jgi:hypothetical protein
MSRAMFRVAAALIEHAPPGIDIVRKPELADLQILHVIGADAIDYIHTKCANRQYAIIQYCFKSAGASVPAWQDVWKDAALVWSYYTLPLDAQRFYHAPLGVDASFRRLQNGSRPTGVMTSGYITGPACEAIEEVAVAAATCRNMPVVHLGPVPVHGYDTTLKMIAPGSWRSLINVADEELAIEYGQSSFVSGLRYVEGFELPAAEGLLCGARPIVFDREEMRKWYNGHAVFVPECTGNELVEHLIPIFERDALPVSQMEHKAACDTFDWARIAPGFWSRMLENAR